MQMAFINDLSRSLGSFGSTQRKLLTLGGGLQVGVMQALCTVGLA